MSTNQPLSSLPAGVEQKELSELFLHLGLNPEAGVTWLNRIIDSRVALALNGQTLKIADEGEETAEQVQQRHARSKRKVHLYNMETGKFVHTYKTHTDFLKANNGTTRTTLEGRMHSGLPFTDAEWGVVRLEGDLPNESHGATVTMPSRKIEKVKKVINFPPLAVIEALATNVKLNLSVEWSRIARKFNTVDNYTNSRGGKWKESTLRSTILRHIESTEVA